MKSKNWPISLVCGGMLALCLSYLIAHYFSTSLFGFYHDWGGWRSITGSSPNQFTQGLEKVSWALLFCASWWMLWRLDLFIASNPGSKSVENEHSHMPNKEQNNQTSKMDEAQRSENFIPEDFDDEYSENSTDKSDESQSSEKARKVIFPTVEEFEMAELLGLSRDQLDDFSKIKSTYRTIIAQYHPDKVSALGSEIREVAEKKAKEINQAYEYFRKKFKNS